MPRMISDLLGATAGGIRNLLVVTGRPPTTGPYPDSTAVLDIDSIGLTNVVHGLNRGVDPGGNSIGSPTRFVIGVRVNPVAADQEQEIGRFRWKADAGAHFVVTPPLFAPGRLKDFLSRVPDLDVPIVVGLKPLTSVGEAEFLHNEVPGVAVPTDIFQRMGDAEADGTGAAVAEGVRIALEVFEEIRDVVAGAHVSVAADHLDGALEVLAGVRATG